MTISDLEGSLVEVSTAKLEERDTGKGPQEEWKAKGVPEADIRRDVKVIMPALDLFPKTK